MIENKLLRGLLLSTTLALLVALSVPVAALADDGDPPGGPDASAVGHVTISGDPLTIHVAEDTSIQVFYAGKTDGQVYPAGYDEADSGGFMWWGRPGIPSLVLGPDWANHDTSSANMVNPWFRFGQTTAGSGTATDPWQVTTYVADAPAQPSVRVVQWIRYVDGDSCFRVLYNVTNAASTAPDPFTFFHAADLHPDDSNNGYGFHDSATDAVGAWNQDLMFLEFLVPVTSDLGFTMPPASHYQEARSQLIWDNIGDLTGPGSGFDDTIRTDWHNSGAGLQWNLNFPGAEIPDENFIEFVFDWCFLEEEQPPPPPPPDFVPEPASLLLLASGLTGLAGYAGLRARKR